MHHTHSWTVDGEVHVLTTHLVMNRGATREDMIEAKARVRELLDEHTFEHVTVDVEFEGELCVIGAGPHDHKGKDQHQH